MKIIFDTSRSKLSSSVEEEWCNEGSVEGRVFDGWGLWPAEITCVSPLHVQNALLPAGLRQRDQTQKPPTGPFKREELMAHLEKQAKDIKDREDLVPFTGEKRGMVILHAMLGASQ